MCRWMGYSGGPVRPEELLYDTEHSLIVQSTNSTMMSHPLNGDGFGLGWYGDHHPEPGVYRNEMPAWNDRNLREIASHVESPLFLAHVRASTGTPAQQTNCHPFRYGKWLFVHNGFINEYHRVRRELLLAVDPRYFDNIEGTTDSELIFHLALTFGLQDDPLGALEQVAGFVEHLCEDHGIDIPFQMSAGISDGERLYAARYASGPEVNSLFVSTDTHTLKEMYPDNPRLHLLSDEARVVVSEPIIDLEGAWQEMDPGTAIIVQDGPDQIVSFVPKVPAGV
ncbi:MAG: class II glutamine amidotransferase [Solirubrobacteraceae bacterium]|nr:class II glutamine amidotransferase [Solirubrobacteraceae bacterium]